MPSLPRFITESRIELSTIDVGGDILALYLWHTVSGRVSGGADPVVPSFKGQLQAQDLWCWAAATSIIDSFYKNGAGLPQCKVADAAYPAEPGHCQFGGPGPSNTAMYTCQNVPYGGRSDCALGNHVGDVELALTAKACAHFKRPLQNSVAGSHTEVTVEIDAGCPVVVQIVDTSDNSAHFRVVYGYSDRYYLAYDPGDGTGGAWLRSEIGRTVVPGAGLWRMSVFTQK